MELKPGLQLASTVCETRIVVVRVDRDGLDLTCGGSPMVPADEAPAILGPMAPGTEGPTAIGKRYTDVDGTLEVLCTKGGTGALAADGAPLEAKAAKPLPSSD